MAQPDRPDIPTLIFQIGTQLVETMRAHTDLSREEIYARAAEVFGGMGFPDVRRILATYPFELSGGMAQRAAIALAVILRPQLLLADEPTSALDATIQLQVLDHLRALRERTGTAILLITHNIGVVRHIADRVAVMCKGKIVEQGSVNEVLGNPQHPYTQELLAAVPKMSAATHTDCDRRDHAEKNTAPIASPVTTGEGNRVSGGRGAHFQDLLRFDSVSMHFDDAAGRVQAVDGISFSLARRELLGIVGESGSGKSTVAKLLTGLHAPTGGRILLGGRDITHTSGRERRALYTRMQMVFQDAVGSFNPRRTIGAMIGETICRLCTPDERDTDKRVAQLTQDNERLRSELDRARRELDEARSSRVSHMAGNTETLQVATREEATPAVVRLVSLATEQAERLVDEANNEAQRKINEAKQQAYEITTDARTRAERIESEARVNADQINRDAQSRADRVNGEVDRRRTELFAELEREQGILTQKVAALRGFESSYRENMRGYLTRHLESLEQNLPEPLDVPELAERSRTPRLDALAAQDRLA